METGFGAAVAQPACRQIASNAGVSQFSCPSFMREESQLSPCRSMLILIPEVSVRTMSFGNPDYSLSTPLFQYWPICSVVGS